MAMSPKNSSPPPTRGSTSPRLLKHPFVTFIALLLTLSALGTWFYLEQKDQLRSKTEMDLRSIMRLKVEQITQWRTERLEGASVIATDPSLGGTIAKTFIGEPTSVKRTLDWMRTLRDFYKYDDIILVDDKRRVRLDLTGKTVKSTLDETQLPPDVLHSGKPAISDFYVNPNNSVVCLNIVAPIFQGKGNQSKPLGVVLLRVRADKFLYPLIQSWPVSSRTAETLLIRKDGDSVLYLNDLRYQKNAALRFRIPLTRTDVTAVMAVQNANGIVQGLDYRGVKVLAAVSAVPNTPWFIVAKIDEDEAFSDWRARSVLIIALVVVVLLFSGIVFLLDRQNAKHRYLESLRRADAKIRESEEKFRVISEASPSFICVRRISDGNIMFTNQAFASAFGYGQDELAGRKAPEVYANSTDRARLWGILQGGGSLRDCEVLVKRKDGSTFWISTSVIPIQYAGEKVVLSASFDITERKKADEEKNRLNRTLKALSNSSKAMMRAQDEDSYLQEVCGIILKDCGYEMVWVGYAEDDEKKTVRPVAHAGFEEKYLDGLNITWADNEMGRGPTGTAIRTGKTALCRHMTTDPAFEPWRENALKRGYASSAVFPLKGRESTVGAITIYSREQDPFSEDEIVLLEELADDLLYGITSLRLRAAHAKNEVALYRSEARLIRAQEVAHLGSWEIDSNQNRLVWSDEAYRIFGMKPWESDLTYEAFLEAVHPDDRAAVAEAYSGSIREGKDGYEVEHRVVRKSDGAVRVIRQKCEHFRDPSGWVFRSVGMVHDITERRQMEDQLVRTLAELRQSNRELEQFAYSVSHDLRAPLHRIEGFSQALLEDYATLLDEQGRIFLQRLLTGSRRMSSVIDALLNLSRITRRGMKNEEVDLSSIVIDVTSELKQQDPGRKVTFVVREGLKAWGDADLIRALFVNLLENAWKYTSKHLECRIEFGLDRTSNRDAYFVRDDGAGFDMAYADKLFEPFQRLHSPSEFTGTGIGLATAQRIVHRHGGRIWAESDVEKGATFYFTLWPEKGETI